MKTVTLNPSSDQTQKSFYGKAHVEESDHKAELISYRTNVATITYDANNHPHLERIVQSSDTTTRHIKAFLDQYGFGDILQGVSGFNNIVRVLRQNGQKFQVI